MKLLKKFLWIIFSFLLLLIGILQLWLYFSKSNLDLGSLFYWLILIGILFGVWSYNKKSGFTFKSALTLFIIGAIFTVINIQNFAEVIMRISFVFLLVGIGQSLIEYNQSEKTTNIKK